MDVNVGSIDSPSWVTKKQRRTKTVCWRQSRVKFKYCDIRIRICSSYMVTLISTLMNWSTRHLFVWTIIFVPSSQKQIMEYDVRCLTTSLLFVVFDIYHLCATFFQDDHWWWRNIESQWGCMIRRSWCKCERSSLNATSNYEDRINGKRELHCQSRKQQ